MKCLTPRTCGADEDLQTAQEAMRWLHRLPHADRQERSAFLQWLCRSPDRVRELLLAATWDLVLCELDQPTDDG